MKKKLLVMLISFVTILLAWCSISNNQTIKIDPEKWILENGISIEETFNKEIDQRQYIKDFENFISFDVFSITEDKPFTSDSFVRIKFDKNSSIEWWVEFLQKKISKKHDLETSNIIFNIQAEDQKNAFEPLNLSWDLSLLYEDNEVYAKLHKIWLFMWEWNMLAKMYTLLWNSIVDKRVDLEVHSWWIVTINEEWDKKLPYIVWIFKNVLKTEDIKSSPNFLWSVAEMIDTINSYINLWISTNWLNLISNEISYFELWDKTIQKVFTWSFQWDQSSFDLKIISQKKWLEIDIYNIKGFNKDISDFKDTDSEFRFILKENKESEYSIEFSSSKSQKNLVDLQWKINYADTINFSADFVLEPQKIFSWQKISWELKWNIIKKQWNWDENIPELTWDILLLSELLSTL